MEISNKSMQPLHFTGFKLIVLSVLVALSGCKPEMNQLEWYFHNHHDEIISLHLYSKDIKIISKTPDMILLHPGDSVSLYSIEVEEGNSSLYTDLIDSAAVYLYEDNSLLAIWRKESQNYIREDFEVIQDFYSWDYTVPSFDYILIINNNHVVYRFFFPEMKER